MKSPADALAARAMKSILAKAYFAEYVKPMGSLVVRFSGKKLAHLGKTVDAALTLAFAALAPHAARELTFRGYWPNGKKRVRYAAPRASRPLVSAGLAGMKKLPAEAAQLYFFDGEGDGLVPDGAALYISLAADHEATFCTGLGFLAIAFPLGALGDPAWKALGDQLVTLLGAEVAWMSPSVWLAPQHLFNGSLNDFDDEEVVMSTLASDPQLDIPSYYASRSPFAFDELEPDALAGVIAPAWITWLTEPLAKKVTFRGKVVKLTGARRFQIEPDPPYALTEAGYALWRARWAELAPVHVTPDEGTYDACASYFLTRFTAEKLANIGTKWRRDRAERLGARKRRIEMSNRIAKLSGKKLLTYANEIAKAMTPELGWDFLPKLADAVREGHAKPGEAIVWLDICEQLDDPDATVRFTHILGKAAEVAAAAGDIARAVDLIARGIEARTIDARGLKREPAFKPLRKDPRFEKLAGG